MTVYEIGFYEVVKCKFYGDVRYLVKRINEQGIEKVCKTKEDAIEWANYYSDIDW